MSTIRCVFIGAKDGVGVTTCAVTAGCALHGMGGRAIIGDWDAAHAGDVAALMGQTAARTVTQLHERRDHLHGEALVGYLQAHPSGLGAVARSTEVTEAMEIALTLAACDAISHCYDSLCIDAGSRLDPLIAVTLANATHIVLVCRPEFSAIHAAARWLERFRHAFVPRHRILVLYNQWDGASTLTPTLVEKRLAVDRCAVLPAATAALITAHHQGIPLAFNEPHHPYVAALRTALTDFFAATDGTEGGRIDPARLLGRPIDGYAKPLECALTPSPIALREELLVDLQHHMDAQRLHLRTDDAASRHALAIEVERHVCTCIDRIPVERLAGIDRAALVTAVLHDAIGLGPLEPLLQDPSISEVMVNGPDRIYIERHGCIEATDVRLPSAAHLMRIIERIVAPMGRRIDESTPMVDVRLADGSRVHVIIPPLALTGPTITIRRFPARRLTMDDLVARGSVTPAIATLLHQLIRERRNIVVAGGTGTGKTTLLNILSAAIPAAERIITIEDAAELQLAQPHVVRLEARPPNVEGAGAVTIRDLVRNALRMRPDRIVIGECRGGEALDMLQAMNTGHDGSITTIHANSPRDCLTRLETLVMFAGMDLPSRAIRDQIAGAIHYIAQLARCPDGRRVVTGVVRVVGLLGQQIELEEYHATAISQPPTDRAVSHAVG